MNFLTSQPGDAKRRACILNPEKKKRWPRSGQGSALGNNETLICLQEFYRYNDV